MPRALTLEHGTRPRPLLEREHHSLPTARGRSGGDSVDGGASATHGAGAAVIDVQASAQPAGKKKRAKQMSGPARQNKAKGKQAAAAGASGEAT